jgi:hypothetical protein
MRENVQRRIVVQINVSGRDLRSVVNEIQGRVSQNVTMPQGYHDEYGGQFESEAQASQQLLWLSLGVIVAIFFILSSAFSSPRDALLIMVNLPLALIGGVIGVYLSGGVLSVASIVGFITLFGIATRNRHLQEHEGGGPHSVRTLRASCCVTCGFTDNVIGRRGVHDDQVFGVFRMDTRFGCPRILRTAACWTRRSVLVTSAQPAERAPPRTTKDSPCPRIGVRR